MSPGSSTLRALAPTTRAPGETTSAGCRCTAPCDRSHAERSVSDDRLCEGSRRVVRPLPGAVQGVDDDRAGDRSHDRNRIDAAKARWPASNAWRGFIDDDRCVVHSRSVRHDALLFLVRVALGRSLLTRKLGRAGLCRVHEIPDVIPRPSRARWACPSLAARSGVASRFGGGWRRSLPSAPAGRSDVGEPGKPTQCATECPARGRSGSAAVRSNGRVRAECEGGGSPRPSWRCVGAWSDSAFRQLGTCGRRRARDLRG